MSRNSFIYLHHFLWVYSNFLLHHVRFMCLWQCQGDCVVLQLRLQWLLAVVEPPVLLIAFLAVLLEITISLFYLNIYIQMLLYKFVFLNDYSCNHFCSKKTWIIICCKNERTIIVSPNFHSFKTTEKCCEFNWLCDHLFHACNVELWRELLSHTLCLF